MEINDEVRFVKMETNIVYIKEKVDEGFKRIEKQIADCPRGAANRAVVNTHSKLIFFIFTFIIAIISWMVTRG